MAGSLVAFQCTVLYIASWALYKVFLRVVTQSDLNSIPGPPSESYLKGVFARMFHVNAWDYHRKLWETYGPVIKIPGLFGEAMLYTFDPKTMHHILVKDVNMFQPSESILIGTGLILGKGLLGTIGIAHSRQRKLLNPVFSVTHMREIVPMFYDVAHKLEASLLKQIMEGPKEIDMAVWMGRTALELIGQAGFGHSFDDLSLDYREHHFSSALKQLLPVAFKLALFRTYFLPYAAKLGPPSFRRALIGLLPIKAFKEMRNIVDALHYTTLEIYSRKKKAINDGNLEVLEQINKGKDILSIMMRQNMQAPEVDKLSEEEIHAQISTFTFAGMDTTSNALSRTLWILAQDKDAQSRLRAEIRQAVTKAKGDLSYDKLVSLPYLDAICRETLRLYPPINQIMRQPIKDTAVPLSSPITLTSGRTTSELLIPKGTKCILSLIASNRNTELWGNDAHEWKPERWMGLMKEEIVAAKVPGVYSHLMTFGGGPRACIGFKFSQLEMKVVLATLLSRFDLSLGSQDIAWQMSTVVVPVVKGGDQTKPSMRLVVALAD